VIAAIVVAVILVVAALSFGAWWVCRRRSWRMKAEPWESIEAALEEVHIS
jgi:heme/copper-type cytochrome/quinol oxidase subunit 2